MTKPELSGEERTRLRNRKTIMLIVAGMLLGGVIGGVAAFGTEGDFLASDAQWSPVAALVVAAAIALVGPPLIYMAYGTADDFELANQARGFEVGAWTFFGAYPVWFALWKGGFVPEPSHEILFAGFFIATMAGYLWQRLR